MSLIHADPNFLMHYGILGMKWGVRRYQDKSGRLTPAGQKHYSGKSNVSSEKGAEKNGSLAAVAAIAALYALPPLTAVTIAAIGQASANSKERRQDKHAASLEKDPETGLPVKDKEYSAVEDCKKVNPARGSGDNDLMHNCTMCSLAFDIRRRGYDVRAGRADFGLTDDEMARFYGEGNKMTDCKVGDKKVTEYYSPDEIRIRKNRDRSYLSKMPKEIRDYNNNVMGDIAKQGEGARGMLTVGWVGQWSGHAVAYQVENGKTVIYDCQQGRKIDIKEFSNRNGVIKSYMRTDDKTPDYKFITEKAYIV